MLDHLPGDPKHIRRLPCEHVLVCLEEGDELEFLFGVNIGSNLNCLGWFRRVEGHCLDATIGLFGVDVIVGLAFGIVRFRSASKTYEPRIFGLDDTLVPLTCRICVLRSDGHSTEVFDHIQALLVAFDRRTLISFNNNGPIGTRDLE